MRRCAVDCADRGSKGSVQKTAGRTPTPGPLIALIATRGRAHGTRDAQRTGPTQYGPASKFQAQHHPLQPISWARRKRRPQHTHHGRHDQHGVLVYTTRGVVWVATLSELVHITPDTVGGDRASMHIPRRALPGGIRIRLHKQPHLKYTRSPVGADSQLSRSRRACTSRRKVGFITWINVVKTKGAVRW